MTPAPRGSTATLATNGEKRSWFGRALRWFLEPIYWWGDFKGADGRPSYFKLMGTASFIYGLVLLFRLWSHYFAEIEGAKTHPGTGELAFLLAFSFLVFYLPYGIKGLALYAQSRGAGAADALTKAAEREPETLRAQAVLEQTRATIAERRAAADGDYEATP